MIDWIKARLPLEWVTPICDGHLVRVSPSGEVERSQVLSAHVRGSFDEHVTLRTVERGFVEFDGNPSKFVQGHNLFGSWDLCGLVEAAAVKALTLLGVTPSAADRRAWLNGWFEVQRVDLTDSYELPNLADCRQWLRAASELAVVKWKGRATVHGGSLYFGKVPNGKRAARWSMKIYAKGDEIAAPGRGHRLSAALPFRDDLAAWASNKLRWEVLLRRAEIERTFGEAATRGSWWSAEQSEQVFLQYAGKVQIGDAVMIEAIDEQTLKPAVRACYNLWYSGADCARIYPRASLYRYRREILGVTDGAVDVLVPRPKTVVPLRRVLEARPSSVPAFAAGTFLAFRRAPMLHAA